MRQIAIADLKFNKLYRDRFAAANITTVNQMMDGWETTIPEIIGVRHHEIKNHIKYQLNKMGYEIERFYRLRTRKAG